jgi:hypothetical protein
MAQRTWNVKVKGSKIRFAAGGRPRIGPPRSTARRLLRRRIHETPIKYSRPGNRPLGEVPVRPAESSLPPDGVVAATRRKVSRSRPSPDDDSPASDRTELDRVEG